jgi:hypothetical protein
MTSGANDRERESTRQGKSLLCQKEVFAEGGPGAVWAGPCFADERGRSFLGGLCFEGDGPICSAESASTFPTLYEFLQGGLGNLAHGILRQLLDHDRLFRRLVRGEPLFGPFPE